ncbi:MAG: class I SAM-dependent methyltransferase [Chloroflexi bacterium]|nr:class I SAM-dependent methyltransferase [Chloroflexota bacterium]
MIAAILHSRAYSRLIRWAFERFYHEFAWTYDVVAALVSAGRWRDWVLTSVAFAHGRTLELGCGTGYVQLALARRHSGAPVGLDRSASMLRLTQRRLARAGVQAPLVRADARALPFSAASLDSIIATFPSEYITADATVAEIRRVLRPGGTVAVALWARFSGDSWYARLVDLAYRLTLQRSPRPVAPTGQALPDAQQRLGERFARAGMCVSYAEAPTTGGTVQYVIAGIAE